MPSELELLREEARRVHGRIVIAPDHWELYIGTNPDNAMSGGRSSAEQIVNYIRGKYPFKPTAREALDELTRRAAFGTLAGKNERFTSDELAAIIAAALKEQSDA